MKLSALELLVVSEAGKHMLKFVTQAVDPEIGVYWIFDDGRMVAECPDAVFAASLIEAEHKAERKVRRLLKYVMKSGVDMFDLMEHSKLWDIADIDDERLAIMEMDGGMPRWEAEAEWLIGVKEIK